MTVIHAMNKSSKSAWRYIETLQNSHAIPQIVGKFQNSQNYKLTRVTRAREDYRHSKDRETAVFEFLNSRVRVQWLLKLSQRKALQ